MSRRQKILLFVAALGIILMTLSIIWGNNGLMDLIESGEEKTRIAEKNEMIRRDNVTMYREIDRLNTDPVYLEEVVRKESGMVRPDELVIRMKSKKEEKAED